MQDLGDTVIAFSVVEAMKKTPPDTIGAAFLSALALLTSDLIATGPYSDMEKETIFHSVIKMMQERYPKSLDEFKANRKAIDEQSKVILERNFNRNSAN